MCIIYHQDLGDALLKKIITFYFKLELNDHFES